MANTSSSSGALVTLPRPSDNFKQNVAPKVSLLQLPTEILMNVVRKYVNTVDIEEAWYMRVVCRKCAIGNSLFTITNSAQASFAMSSVLTSSRMYRQLASTHGSGAHSC
jgi:hypothetical protein